MVVTQKIVSKAEGRFVALDSVVPSEAALLAVPGIREALMQSRAPVVAVSPLIGGQAAKGPTAKLMAELGLAVDHTVTLMKALDDKVRVAKAGLALAAWLA